MIARTRPMTAIPRGGATGETTRVTGVSADEVEALVTGGNSGSGTLSVDGKTLDLHVFFCGFGPDETRNGSVEFSFPGSGTDEGRDLTLDGAIISSEATSSESHNLDSWYSDESATVIYKGAFDAEDRWAGDRKDVGLEGGYVDANQECVGPATFEGICP